MKDVIDLHTHTLASGHAYGTIKEQIEAGKERGLELLGITEHAPSMPGSCNKIYFENIGAMPNTVDGLQVLYGAEVNILDSYGRVDLSQSTLKKMDVVIASLHIPCYAVGSKEENTRAYLNVMKNPYVNIIGHPDDARFPVDYRAIVEEARKRNILLEVNNSSMSKTSYRENASELYMELLNLCKIYETPVIMGSDAHTSFLVGAHENAVSILKKVEFPEELIVNSSVESVKKYLNYYKKFA
ncbi:MAG: phosphatase [Lachnospiraceae bacterium]